MEARAVPQMQKFAQHGRGQRLAKRRCYRGRREAGVTMPTFVLIQYKHRGNSPGRARLPQCVLLRDYAPLAPRTREAPAMQHLLGASPRVLAAPPRLRRRIHDLR